MTVSRIAGLLPCLASAAALACAGSATPAGGDVPPHPVPVAVGVTPAYLALAVSQSTTFDATVTGTTLTSVTWTAEPDGCGSVVSTGARASRYTAPASTGACRVRATSVADTARSAFAAVTVTPAGAGGVCGAAAGQLFPADAPWNVPVDGAPLDGESDQIIGYLAANHGAAYRFQITFDFNVLFATSTVARRSFTQTGDFFSPDCDPAPMPVPPGGRLEGESDYSCAGDGDCHLTVVDTSSCRLWEMWRADIPNGQYDGSGFAGGCLAIWDLASTPPADERGEYCTSADAAGLPVLPLVFTADEVAAGHIDHALRFILPNSLIRHFIYVRPGTHSTDPTGGGASAPPYAVRVRLKAGKDLSAFPTGAKVIAQALKRYGMILADGGNVTFTAATDDLTTHKWAEVGVGASTLKSLLSWSDFEVVELGTRFNYGSGSCDRTPLAH